MKKFSYVIKDEAGIHARPAGMLVKEVKKYESSITILKDGKSVEATKIIAIMGMDIKYGQMVEVEIIGVDEEAAFKGIKEFFEKNL